MLGKTLKLYKVPLLVSLVISVVLIALKVEKQYFQISLIFLGSLLGTFFLDLDYFIYTYFLDPAADFSKTVAGFIKHRDLPNALSYIYYHKEDLHEKTLNSALFQLVLGGLMIFVTSSSTNLFVKALVLSTFANSLYRLAQNYYENKTAEWFWIFKNVPNKKSVVVYTVILFGIFLYCLTLF